MSTINRLLSAFKGTIMLEECTRQELIIIATELSDLKRRGFSPATCGIRLKGNKAPLLQLTQNRDTPLEMEWLESEPKFMTITAEPRLTGPDLEGDFREQLVVVEEVPAVHVNETERSMEAAKLPSDDNIAQVNGFSTAELDDLWMGDSGDVVVKENVDTTEAVQVDVKLNIPLQVQPDIQHEDSEAVSEVKSEAQPEIEAHPAASQPEQDKDTVEVKGSDSVQFQQKVYESTAGQFATTLVNGEHKYKRDKMEPFQDKKPYNRPNGNSNGKTGYEHVLNLGEEALYNKRQEKVYKETIEKYSRYPDSGSGWGEPNSAISQVSDKVIESTKELATNGHALQEDDDPWADDNDDDLWSQPKEQDDVQQIGEDDDDPWLSDDSDPWADEVTQTNDIQMSSGWGITSRDQSPQRGRVIEKPSYASAVSSKPVKPEPSSAQVKEKDKVPPPGLSKVTQVSNGTYPVASKFKLTDKPPVKEVPQVQEFKAPETSEDCTRIKISPVPSHIQVNHINKLFGRFGVVLFAQLKNGTATVEYFENSEARAAYDALHQGVVFGQEVELVLM